jgi:hypothetical protein
MEPIPQQSHVQVRDDARFEAALRGVENVLGAIAAGSLQEQAEAAHAAMAPPLQALREAFGSDAQSVCGGGSF